MQTYQPRLCSARLGGWPWTLRRFALPFPTRRLAHGHPWELEFNAGSPQAVHHQKGQPTRDAPPLLPTQTQLGPIVYAGTRRPCYTVPPSTVCCHQTLPCFVLLIQPIIIIYHHHHRRRCTGHSPPAHSRPVSPPPARLHSATLSG